MRYERAHEQGLDEVLLLNERGEVSECTSANIFVAQGDRVWTPPQSAGCLAGVTRGVLLEEVKVPGLEIGEKALFPQDLESADEVFITSTTRELLPVYPSRASAWLRSCKPRPVATGLSSRVEAYTAGPQTHTRHLGSVIIDRGSRECSLLARSAAPAIYACRTATGFESSCAD